MNLRKVAAIATSVLMFAPLSALASTNITFLTLNGAANATVGVGDNVDGKLTFDLTGSSENESLSWELVDNGGNNVGIPPTCVDVNDHIVAGTYNASFPMDTIGGTEGTFGIKVKLYGVVGSGTDNSCSGTVNDTMTFSNRLTLTAGETTGNTANNTGHGSGNSGSSTSIQSQINTLASQLSQLVTAFSKFVTGGGTATPPSTTSAVCTAYAQANAGTVPNTNNAANVRLQGFLLSQGASIPALAAGASFGFYGNQTTAAVGWFNSLNHCQ